MDQAERLLNILGDIDDTLVASAAPQPSVAARPKRRGIQKLLPAVACLALTAVLSVTAWGLYSGNRTPTEAPPDSELISTTVSDSGMYLEMAGVLDNTLATQNPAFTLNGISYTCPYPNTVINTACLGEHWCNTAMRRDRGDLRITCYTIADVAPQMALAVRFEDRKDYFVYVNGDYRPDTLGDMIESFCLRELMQFGDVYLDRREGANLHSAHFSDPDDSLIWNTLLANLSLQLCYDPLDAESINPASDTEIIEISFTLPHLAVQDGTMWVTDNGYLVLELFNTPYVFAVNSETVQDLVILLLLKCADLELLENRITLYPIPAASTTATRVQSIRLGGIEYYNEARGQAIDIAYIGDLLGESTVLPFNETAEKAVACYRLGDIAPDCAIAAQFEGEDTYHLFLNQDYRPETLGDMIEDLNLKEYLDFGNVTITYRQDHIEQTLVFSAPDSALLWNTLLADIEADTETDIHHDHRGDLTLSVSVSVSLLNIHRLAISAYGDGYLHTNLYSYQSFDFPLSEGRIQDCLLALIQSGTDYTVSTKDYSKSSLPSDLLWQDMTSAQRFGTFRVGDTVYKAKFSAVDAAELGERLGDTSTYGYNREDDILCQADLTYYTIRGISPDAAVAVQFSSLGDDTCYLYLNPAYRADTLGQLIEDLDLYARMILLDITYPTRDENGQKIAITDAESLWNFLFAHAEAKTSNEKLAWYRIGSAMTIRVSVPTLGAEEASLQISESGYLVTDLSLSQTSFFLGTEAVQE